MGHRTVAETIREITRVHLTENGGLLLGQSISAVGWVNNTVPNVENIIELPMTEQGGSGFAVGAAMVGKRPILVLRFQDFLLLNGSSLLNYAAKSKELHGRSTPVFVRALASEGLGPVHSGVFHSLCMHYPGFRVWAPITPGEYQDCWRDYMEHDDPMLASEHKASLQNREELPDRVLQWGGITLFAISSPRFALQEAADRLTESGIRCHLVHLAQLKPFVITERMLQPLQNSRLGLVIDAGYEICGASRSLAYELSVASGHPVRALGLMDKTKCLCPPLQNAAPDAARICETVKQILRDVKG